MSKNKRESPWKAFFLVSAVGVDFAVCIVIGYLLGSWLSRMLGGNPLWLVAGLFVGLTLGAVSVWLLIKPFMEDRHE